MAPPLLPELDPFPARSPGPVVLFLVDGLGWARFRSWRSHRGSGPRPGWIARASPLTTTFPSTTTVALVSLSTACAPASHGVVGYRQYIPRYRTVVDVLKMSRVGSSTPEELVGPDWSPADVSASPSVFRRGLVGAALTRDRFQGSGFTRILYDGAEYVEYTTASDFAHQLATILARPRPPPVVYAYWDELDTLMHVRGVDSRLADLEIGRVFELLGYAARALRRDVARRVTVTVTGDHGQVPATRADDFRLDRRPAISRLMARPLAGDRRAAFFQATPGHREELGRRLNRDLPTGSMVLPMETAVESGLFGPRPFHPELADRLGDWLALVPAPVGVTNPAPGRRPGSRFLLAAHGGLDLDELLVPFIHAPLTEFAGFRPR